MGLVLACWEDQPALGHARLREGLPCGPAPAPASQRERSVDCAPHPPPQEAALCEQAKTLGGPQVQDRLRMVLEQRARVRDLAESRGQALHTCLLMTGFTRAVTQVREPPPNLCLPLGPHFTVYR